MRLSLRNKLILFTGSLVAVVFFITSIIAIKRETRIIKDRLIERGKAMCQTISLSNLDAFIYKDIASMMKLQDAVSALKNQPDVIYAMVIDTTFSVLAHTSASMIGKQSPVLQGKLLCQGENFQVLESKIKNEKSFIITMDIVNPDYGDRYGKVIVALSQKRLLKEVAKLRNKIFSLSIIAIGGTIFVLIVLAQFITRPLTELRKGITDLAKGNLNVKIKVNSKDELGELAEWFNKMVTDLKQHIEFEIKAKREEERIKRELDMARMIQRNLLPKILPTLPGFKIAQKYLPAYEVSGDYFDFIPVNKDCLGIIIADIMGKGVPAGLVMTEVRSAIHVFAKGETSPLKVLSMLNSYILPGITQPLFVTMFYCILNSKENMIKYVSAGHPPPVVVSNKGIKLLETRGIPVGVLGDEFQEMVEEKEEKIEKGDLIVLYTDGITEARNNSNELFGRERLIEILKKNYEENPEKIVDIITNSINKWMGGKHQSDDIALVVIKKE